MSIVATAYIPAPIVRDFVTDGGDWPTNAYCLLGSVEEHLGAILMDSFFFHHNEQVDGLVLLDEGMEDDIRDQLHEMLAEKEITHTELFFAMAQLGGMRDFRLAMSMDDVFWRVYEI